MNIMNRPSPLDSIFSVLAGLPKGQDKPLKQALYNAVAIFVLVLSCTAGWGLYHILQPFMKPLMWAVLVGSTLHPLKRTLRHKFQNWFVTLEETNTPAIVGVILLPLNIFNEFSECVGTFLQNRLKLILGICSVIAVSILLYHFSPRFLLSLIWSGAVLTMKSLNCFINATSVALVLLLVLGYLGFIFFLWKPENNIRFHYVSMFIWLLAISCFSGLFGAFQTPIFIILLCVFFGGFIWEVYEAYLELNSAGHSISFSDLLLHVFHDKPLEIDVNEEEIAKTNSEIKNTMENEENDEEAKKAEVEKIDPTKVSTTVKWADPNDSSTAKNNGDHVPSRKKKQDKLWSLELFEDTPEKSHSNGSDDSQNMNRTGVLITNQGIHLIQHKKEKPQFLRSISQPHFTVSRLRKANALGLRRKSYPELTQMYESSYYLYSVVWACILMLFCKNHMLFPLLTVPVVYYVLKHLGKYLGVSTYVYDKLETLFTIIRDWCVERHDALVPVPIRGFYKFLEKANTVIKNSIKDSIDSVASCVVIVGIIVFVISASIFIIVQIYAETILLVQLTGNAINQTIVQNPELRKLLPPSWDDTLDSLLDNAYQYGREGISKAIRGLMTDVESEKSFKLEQQVLELWDRAYQSWMSSNGNGGPKVTDDAVKNSWESFIADLQKSPEIFNLNSIMEFGKQNVGTLLSLLDSVWGILVNNVTIILTSFSTCVSVLLGGGTALLNFLLNMVVFLTTLFYLLSSSGENYKPVEVMTKFSSSSRRFGYALEGAINSVFSASFKMAVFYGLYTWFIHNLFGVKIVYLPSAFGTILGAVPFLGTYWACVPAVLDLWLAQDRWMAAILFAAVQFLPTNFVDNAIYSEIKGGHPYLTGLAIAGGIFCLGVEGAIIGPLLLCGLYVAMDLSSTFFKDSPTDGLRDQEAKENAEASGISN